jgi:hypothetical protein
MEKIDIFDVTITVFYAFYFFKVIHKNSCNAWLEEQHLCNFYAYIYE